MTLRTTPLSPSQKSASTNPRVQDPGNLLIRSRMAKVPTVQEKQNAADQMRYQLYLLDRSSRRMSIEDCVAALLGNPGNELPS